MYTGSAIGILEMVQPIIHIKNKSISVSGDSGYMPLLKIIRLKRVTYVSSICLLWIDEITNQLYAIMHAFWYLIYATFSVDSINSGIYTLSLIPCNYNILQIVRCNNNWFYLSIMRGVALRPV